MADIQTHPKAPASDNRRETSRILIGVRGLLRTVGIVFAGLLFVDSASALDPGTHLTQYQHTAWRVQDGYFTGIPVSITQTGDGYIWVGTLNGLSRFDGVRFEPFKAPAGDSLRTSAIATLKSAADGSLWIGTFLDLEHWQNGRLTHYPSDRKQFSARFLSIIQARDGSIWTVKDENTNPGPLCKVQGLDIHCYGAAEGVEPEDSLALLEDTDGSFWFADTSSLFHWDPKLLRALPGSLRQISRASVESIVLQPDHSILIGLMGNSVGLGAVSAGKFNGFKVGSLDGRKISVSFLLYDSKGALWIATNTQGLYRVVGSQVEHFTSLDGLSDDNVEGLYEDREGDIWAATNKGVDRFRNLSVISYSTREGLSQDHAGAVLAATDGSVWINNFSSLDVLRPDGSTEAFRAGKNLPGDFVSGLMEDHKGRIWVGLDNDIYILDGHSFKKAQVSGTLKAGWIVAMEEDHQGGVWAIAQIPAPRGSLLHFVDDSLKERIPFQRLPIFVNGAMAVDSSGGVWVPLVNDRVARLMGGTTQIIALHNPPQMTGHLTGMMARPDGSVFVSTESTGLAVIREGVSRSLSVREGLPCERISSIAQTSEALWLYAECGIIRLPFTEVDRWWANPGYQPKTQSLDALDGAHPSSGDNFPLASTAPDGRIWFANFSVVQMLDPRKLSNRTDVMSVLIEKLTAGDKSYPLHPDASLPPLTRDVQIDFTSPSFAIPEKIHFRYRLEGLEDEWTDSGTRRQAVFTNLRPGHYIFHVSAAFRDAPWIKESTLGFVIIPKFYQTNWFLFVCGALMLCVVLGLLRLRIEAVRREVRGRLQARMEERERIARDLHDTLFQDMQGILLAVDNSTNKLDEGNLTRRELKNTLELSDQVMRESRGRVLELRVGRTEAPDIGAALSRLCEELAKVYPAQFRVVEVGTPEPLRAVVFEECFLISREALFNAFRHSGAQQVETEILFTDDTFALRVRDDGVGIDAAVLSTGERAGHFGLRGMRERAAKMGAELTIRGGPKMGTEIELSMKKSIACHSTRASGRWPFRHMAAKS